MSHEAEHENAGRLSEVFSRPFDLRLVWAFLPIGLIGLGFVLMPLKSWDYWWHLAYGRVINRTHEMPLFADFLYTLPADHPSYVQAWLSQWALYRIHEAIGLHGVLILRNVFSVGAFTFLGWWAARRARSHAVGSILTLFAVPFGFLCIAARTHLLAWPMFLILLPLGYGIRGKKLPLWMVVFFPMISILWSNVHGTFMIPSLVSLAFLGAAVGDRWVGPREFSKQAVLAWGSATVGSALGTLVNPRGYEIYLYLHDLTTNQENRTYITEWFPATPLNPPFYGALFWFLLILVLVMMWRHRERIDLADLFLLAGFSVLAMGQSRALLWVGLTLPVAAAPYLREWRKYFQPSDEVPIVLQAVNVAVALACVVGIVALQPWSGENRLAADQQIVNTRTSPPYLGLVSADTPVEPIQVLEKADRETLRVFHDHRYPGYILYHLQGDQPLQMVYVDNRVELAPARIWRELDHVSAGEGWRELFDRYDVRAVVAAKKTQSALVEAMRGEEGWALKFETEHYALIERK